MISVTNPVRRLAETAADAVLAVRRIINSRIPEHKKVPPSTYKAAGR